MMFGCEKYLVNQANKRIEQIGYAKIAPNVIEEERPEDSSRIKAAFEYAYPRDIYIDASDTNTTDTVAGLISQIEQMEHGGLINIMLVHGMKTKTLEEMDKVVDKISYQLRRWSVSNDAVQIERPCNYEYVQYGVFAGNGGTSNLKFWMRKIRLGNNSNNLKTVYILMTYVHWSPATIPYKDTVRHHDQIRVEEPRVARANRLLKEEIFLDGLADVAALGLDQVRLNIHLALEAALLAGYANGMTLYSSFSQDSLRFNITQQLLEFNKSVLVTASLGSKVLLDFLASYSIFLEYSEPDSLLYNYAKLSNTDRFIPLLTVSRDDLDSSQIVKSIPISVGSLKTSNVTKRNISDNILTSQQIWWAWSNQWALLAGLNFSMDYIYPSLNLNNISEDTIEKFKSRSITKAMPGSSSTALQMIKLDFIEERANTASYSIIYNSSIVAITETNDLLGYRLRYPITLLESAWNRDMVIKRIDPNYYANVLLPVDHFIELDVVNPVTAHSDISTNPYFQYWFVHGFSESNLPNPDNVKRITNCNFSNGEVLPIVGTRRTSILSANGGG